MIPRPRTRITSHHGAQDALRWGNISFATGERRRFVHDLLSGAIHLYAQKIGAQGGGYVEDGDPRRIGLARKALRA